MNRFAVTQWEKGLWNVFFQVDFCGAVARLNHIRWTHYCDTLALGRSLRSRRLIAPCSCHLSHGLYILLTLDPFFSLLSFFPFFCSRIRANSTLLGHSWAVLLMLTSFCFIDSSDPGGGETVLFYVFLSRYTFTSKA